jgi:carbon starvation protein
MAYWYHFAIMFEAMFILTAVDTGTRVARFIVHEFVHLRGGAADAGGRASYPAIILTSAAACFAWGYLLYGNDIMTIWPMFGIANQLLAAIALAIGTTVILRTTVAKYALATAIPLAFVFVTTLYAGWLNVTTNYLPKQAYLNAFLTAAMMVLSVIIVITSARAWLNVLSGRETPIVAEAEEDAAEIASAGGT